MRFRDTAVAAACLALVTLAPSASAHLQLPSAAPQTRAAITGACPGGKAITPDKVFSGSFSKAQQGSYVMLPFTVPDGTTAVRVKYCYDGTDSPLSARTNNTIDLGLYQAAPQGRLWGEKEFRGWGGSSHPDVTVSAEGYPNGTTRAFRPGPIVDGRWAVELGVAAVIEKELGDSDGLVFWRVEIDLIDSPSFTDTPYVPAPYDRTPARRGARWYAGDMHVHAEHSALSDAPMTDVFKYAFGTAGMDFITLSDYVGGAQWGEIGRHQADHPGKLIMRSAEVITYRGHVNAHGIAKLQDYRTGPILERREDGTLVERRAAQPASKLLSAINDDGGVAQLNHVTIFPSAVPGFAFMCRGCPWDYSQAETDYSEVDAIEVATGPPGIRKESTPAGLPPNGIGPNPFTVTAIDFYEQALAAGHHIAATGSSDDHKAGRASDQLLSAPIGTATTMVYARELSEQAVSCAVEAGHTYVKVFGADRPDLRFTATVPGAEGEAIFGDTIVGGSGIRFTAKVLDAAPVDNQPFQLLVLKNGIVQEIVPVTGSELTHSFTADGPGRYGLRLMRGTSIEAVGTPIWVRDGDDPRVITKTCRTTPPKAKKRSRARARRARSASD